MLRYAVERVFYLLLTVTTKSAQHSLTKKKKKLKISESSDSYLGRCTQHFIYLLETNEMKSVLMQMPVALLQYHCITIATGNFLTSHSMLTQWFRLPLEL